MVKNTIPENWTPESLGLNEADDVLGSKKIEKEKTIRGKVEIHEHATSSLDALKANLDSKQDSLDTLFAPEREERNTPSQPSRGDKVDFSAFSPIDTRREWDIGKNPLRAIPDSFMVFWWAAKDIVVDFAQLIISPREQIQGTYRYLQDLDSNIEIV
jgi:hypothetical protein